MARRTLADSLDGWEFCWSPLALFVVYIAIFVVAGARGLVGV